MHGKAYYQITSLDELRHYAEDAGKSAEEIAAITEPKKELRFLASGVLLLPSEESTAAELNHALPGRYGGRAEAPAQGTAAQPLLPQH